MFFENVKLFDAKSSLDEGGYIYAHLKNCDDKETLKEHLDLSYDYFIKLCNEKNIDDVFEKFENIFFQACSINCKQIFRTLIVNTVYMHDIGKVNGSFQIIKMKNERYKKINSCYSKHSMFSSVMYFDYYFNKIRLSEATQEECMSLYLFLTINAYIISKHHGMLDSFDDFIELFPNEFDNYHLNKELFKSYKRDIKLLASNVEKIMDKIKNYLKKHFGKKDSDVELYVYSKFMFSVLTSCDFYATSQYQNGFVVEEFGSIDNVNKYYDVYKQSKLYKGIQAHKDYLNGKGELVFDNNNINRLRTEMNIQVKENIEKNIEKNIFYLEAPTGSGKTITSIDSALKLLEMDCSLTKIFYIFPFNTLVEQTKSVFVDDIFSKVDGIKTDIAVINSITPIATVDKAEDNQQVLDYDSQQSIDYEKSLLNRQFLHYPIILTTHVNLFNYLFGISREENFPLVHLVNSVVVLDEIQSYKNNIWKEIIIFLEKYSKILNIKVIIMSATLPNLDKIGCKLDDSVHLLNNRDYFFNNKLFKNRVELDFEMINNKNFCLEHLVTMVIKENKKYNKLLIEFIKKKSAIEFYKLLKDKEIDNVMLITGDDNKNERKRVIDSVKNSKKVILVTTQVIEAGVDIDMDVGFKDISILDAEEQFLGRINRSCKKVGSKVYFFNFDDASLIYKGDFRKQKNYTLCNEDMKDVLLTKKFDLYYKNVMDDIESSKSKYNDDNIELFFKNSVAMLNFKNVRKKMKLIDDTKQYTVFLNTTLDLGNGQILRGDFVWKEYKSIITDNSLTYSKRRIKLSIVMEQVDCFTYKLAHFTNSYSDQIGDIFYIDDGEKYFTDGKFDRSKFGEDIDFEFL